MATSISPRDRQSSIVDGDNSLCGLDFKYRFVLRTEGRDYQLYAASSEEKYYWIHGVNRILKELRLLSKGRLTQCMQCDLH